MGVKVYYDKEISANSNRYIVVGSYLIDKKKKIIVSLKPINLLDPISARIKINDEPAHISKDLKYPKFVDIADNTVGGIKHIEMVAENRQKLVLDIVNIKGKNRVINLDDPFVTEISSIYFDGLKFAKNYSASNLKRVNAYYFLNYTENLEKVYLPNLTDVEIFFLCHSAVKEVYVPNLQKIGVGFLEGSLNLKTLTVPAYIIDDNKMLEEINTPPSTEFQESFEK